VSQELDLEKLREAIAAYTEAKIKLHAAKKTRKETLTRLEAEKVEANEIYNKAFADYIEAGIAVTAFTDEEDDEEGE
jgi:hypothetical protein